MKIKKLIVGILGITKYLVSAWLFSFKPLWTKEDVYWSIHEVYFIGKD